MLMKPVSLSSCCIAQEAGILRELPGQRALGQPSYDRDFDFDTLFYDVVRVERSILFIGPPLLNLEAHLRKVGWILENLKADATRNAIMNRKRVSEIWIDSPQNFIELKTALGSFALVVQENLSFLFQGRRVLMTMSKNNPIAWIIDWIDFHINLHGADAVLIYDNQSDTYSAWELEQQLRSAFPGTPVLVMNWPFKYGPQKGGQPLARWDSDFCQPGMLQHARFRMLQLARSD
jgi:hypothetical protein